MSTKPSQPMNKILSKADEEIELMEDKLPDNAKKYIQEKNDKL